MLFNEWVLLMGLTYLEEVRQALVVDRPRVLKLTTCARHRITDTYDLLA